MRRCRPRVSRNAVGRASAAHVRDRLPGSARPLSLSTSRLIPSTIQRKRLETTNRTGTQEDERERHPELQLADGRVGQELRKPSLELGQPGVFVHARDVGHRVGRHQPHRRARLLRHAREEDVHALAVGQHGGADALPIRGQAVVDAAAGVAAQAIEVALEPVVEHEAELFGGLLLARAASSACGHAGTRRRRRGHPAVTLRRTSGRRCGASRAGGDPPGRLALTGPGRAGAPGRTPEGPQRRGRRPWRWQRARHAEDD